MSYVQLNEKLIKAAQRRAFDDGYADVNEYIADLVARDLADDRYEHIFTAELLARLEKISGQIKAGGKTYTLAEVRGLFASRHDE